MQTNNPIVTIRGLSKTYSGKKVVDNIDLDMDEGDFTGLLGPNGAGKTTTIKMLTGLIKPGEGSIGYYGKDFLGSSKESKKFIGVVPQQSNLDRDLTAYENLYFHSILFGVPSKERRDRIEESLTFAGLSDYRDKQVKTFSGGMKRRLVIVRALLHDPKILFLDEPTVGLDPQIRRSIWELIVKVNQTRKTAILLTTHYIEEAEKLCNKVMIINAGKIIAKGKPDKLKKEVGAFVLETFMETTIDEQFFDTREEALASIQECKYPCKVREVTLEDIFIKITGKRINV